MVIRLNLGALKQTQWHEYLVRFVLGGLITAVAGWLAEEFGPVFGGLFLAFPAIFPASATLLEKHEREKKRKAGITSTVRGRLAAALDARGAVMGSIGAMVFAFVLVRLIRQVNVWHSLTVATAAWLATSAGLWYLRKHHPWARRHDG
jgi:Protein of unknown function (DUF3147)